MEMTDGDDGVDELGHVVSDDSGTTLSSGELLAETTREKGNYEGESSSRVPCGLIDNEEGGDIDGRGGVRSLGGDWVGDGRRVGRSSETSAARGDFTWDRTYRTIAGDYVIQPSTS